MDPIVRHLVRAGFDRAYARSLAMRERFWILAP